MFIELDAEQPEYPPCTEDSTIRWQPGSTCGGVSEGPTLKPRLDDFDAGSLQRPIWPGTDLSPQVQLALALLYALIASSRFRFYATHVLCFLQLPISERLWQIAGTNQL